MPGQAQRNHPESQRDRRLKNPHWNSIRQNRAGRAFGKNEIHARQRQQNADRDRGRTAKDGREFPGVPLEQVAQPR